MRARCRACGTQISLGGSVEHHRACLDARVLVALVVEGDRMYLDDLQRAAQASRPNDVLDALDRLWRRGLVDEHGCACQTD